MEGMDGAGNVGGAGADGIETLGRGSCTAWAVAGEGDTDGWGAVVDKTGACITLVYSPGPLGSGGALRSGRPTGPEAMWSFGAAGSGGNPAEGKVGLGAPLDTEKSLGASPLG
jgi:hypothetical protein